MELVDGAPFAHGAMIDTEAYSGLANPPCIIQMVLEDFDLEISRIFRHKTNPFQLDLSPTFGGQFKPAAFFLSLFWNRIFLMTGDKRRNSYSFIPELARTGVQAKRFFDEQIGKSPFTGYNES